MKTQHITSVLVFSFLTVLALSFCIAGCSTTQQRTTYNTLASVEATATATVDGYFLAAVKGLAPTNGIPTVSKAYNEFQSTMTVAIDLAQNNSNALASSNVLQELSDVVKAVSQFAAPTTTSPKITPTP